MNESKIEATHRLQREGRWDAASLFRDQKRRQFRGEGKLRKEAVELSWEAMVAEYPPLKMDSVSTNATIEALVARDPEDVEELDPAQEIEWVAFYLTEDSLSADNFPSLGAWSLWKWARDNRDRFFNALWPRTELARAIQHPTDDEDAAEFEEFRAHWAEAFAVDLPGALRRRVANELTDVSQRFGLEAAPAEWSEALLKGVLGLVNRKREAPGG